MLTCQDALPLSNRRVMGAKVIKLEVHMRDIPLAARTGMSIGSFSISGDIKKIVKF